MQMPAISVIIPLYNAERYVAECLDSILAQTFQNFEVVVVDDCSTDSSVAIVESYLPKFNGRLTISRMEKNSGSGGLPRNKGMMISRGEYIFFADSDDMITATALEEMYALAKKFDADVIYCEKHWEVDSDGTNKRISMRQKAPFVEQPTLETKNLAERVKEILHERFFPGTCFYSARRRLVMEHQIFFPQICPSEDDVYTLGLIFYAKNFLRAPNAFYVRRNSEDSVMRSKKTPQQTINFWLNPALFGLKTLDKFMSNHEFFKRNPQFRYAVLEKFINSKFDALFKDSSQIPPFAVYETIKQKFGDRLGEHDVLIAALCTALNTRQKLAAINRQQFRKFAAQAQKRIAELEAEIKRLKPEE